MRRPVASVLAFIILCFVPRIVLAACNALPGASEAGSGDGGGPPMHKAALGSISQTHLIPGVSASVVLKADDICVGDPDRRLTFPRPKTDAYVVALVNARDETTAVTYPIVVTSSQARCDAIHTTMTERFGTKWACSARGTVAPAMVSDPSTLRFSLAALPAGVFAMAGSGQTGDDLALASGPMKVFATNESDAVERLAAVLTGNDCTSICPQLATDGAFACVDSFYEAAGPSMFQLSNVTCDLEQLPSPDVLKPTKFLDQCMDKSGNPGSLPKCTWAGLAQKMDIYVDACGNLKIPVDFQGLLDTSKKPEGEPRILSGKSAVSRFKDEGTEDSQLWIPGREFIGSTPSGDAKGIVSDWQLPKMSVFYEDSSQTFGIRGLVDKQGSHYIHIVPRRPVRYRCEVAAGEDPEACEKVEEEFGVVKTMCACSDSYGLDCKCQPPLPEGLAEYFACRGGKFDGMPCTRPAHCREEGGTCTRQPKCQTKKSAVFSENSPDGGTIPCWREETCTPTGEQCGYDLFDFRDRVKGNNIYTLDSKIKKNVDPNRRGVCKGSIGTVCNNQNEDTKCTAANDVCVGYTLTAEGPP